MLFFGGTLAAAAQAVASQLPQAAAGTTPATAAKAPFSTLQIAPGVERVIGMRGNLSPGAPALARPARKASYHFTVTPAGAAQQAAGSGDGGAWLDTGLDVFAGESVSVTTSGSITLGDGRVVSPDGTARGWRDLLRQFPDDRAQTGALIARISDLDATVPFPLVASTADSTETNSSAASHTVTLPTSGRLFLAVNEPSDLAGTGSFSVTLRFIQPPLATGTANRPASSSISPASAGISAAGPAGSSVTTSAIALPAAAMSTAARQGALAEIVTPATFATIPRRVADAHGDPGDMVNFALIGSEAQVKAAFAAAGWLPVDANVGNAIVHGLMATLEHESYTALPMSTLYLFGRPQDLSFARADAFKVVAQRHHLRVWNSGQTIAGVPLWVGSATHDVGIERDGRTKAEGGGSLTHRIDPDVDLERNFLLESFDAAGSFRSATLVTPADPVLTANTATGGSFHSDGRILVLALE